MVSNGQKNGQCWRLIVRNNDYVYHMCLGNHETLVLIVVITPWMKHCHFEHRQIQVRPFSDSLRGIVPLWANSHIKQKRPCKHPEGNDGKGWLIDSQITYRSWRHQDLSNSEPVQVDAPDALHVPISLRFHGGSPSGSSVQAADAGVAEKGSSPRGALENIIRVRHGSELELNITSLVGFFSADRFHLWFAHHFDTPLGSNWYIVRSRLVYPMIHPGG